MADRAGLPTDEELMETARRINEEDNDAWQALREVRARTLRWAADQGDSRVNIREILREAAAGAERG